MKSNIILLRHINSFFAADNTINTLIKSSKKLFIWFGFVSAILLSTVINLQAQSRATDGPTPSGLAKGAPAGSYSLTGFENVNLYNGNLNFNLPLLKVGGRGAVQSSVQTTIDSSHWSVRKTMGSRGNVETYDPYNVGTHPPIVGGGSETPHRVGALSRNRNPITGKSVTVRG